MKNIYTSIKDFLLISIKEWWAAICSVLKHFLCFLEEKVLFRKKGEDVRTAKSDERAALLLAGDLSEMFQVLKDINADKGRYMFISLVAVILYCIFVISLVFFGFGYLGWVIIPSIFVQVLFQDNMKMTWKSLNDYLAHFERGNAIDAVSVKLFSDILYYYDKSRSGAYYHLYSVIGLFIIALVIGVILQ